MFCFALKTIVICTNNGLDIKILYINLNVCGTIWNSDKGDTHPFQLYKCYCYLFFSLIILRYILLIKLV